MTNRAHELSDDFLGLFGGGKGKKAGGTLRRGIRRGVRRLKNILSGKKAKAGGARKKTSRRKKKAGGTRKKATRRRAGGARR